MRSTNRCIEAGCEKIYTEKASGAEAEWPELQKLLLDLRTGAVVVIWKPDRLGRALRHLVELVHSLMEKEVGLQSLNDLIDTTTAQGRLCLNTFVSLAEFEREIIKERTQAGSLAARARGRVGGRPKGLSQQAQTTPYAVETLYRERKLTVQQMCKWLSILKRALYLRYRRV